MPMMVGGGSNSAKRNNDDVIYSGHMGNGAKKMKIDASAPSKVVHLRGLPNEVSEGEVIQLGMAYGKVTNILMLKGKGQAFLEMENEDVAQDMVYASDAKPPSIRQRTIYVQYSNHKALRTDNSPGQVQTQALLRAMQQAEGGTNHVLRVVVENMLYPITVEVLHKIFHRFGTVMKVITFNKNGQFQALIQMADAIESGAAKLALDGQNIYNNCCTLRIEFSKMTSLNVKYNNEKSYDFTRPDLPSGEGQGLLGDPTTALRHLQGREGGRGLMSSPMQSQNPLAAVLQNPQFASLASRASAGALTSAGNLAALAAQISGPQHAVLHVSNLNVEMIEPRHLFTLFGVYGDVIRVKIFFQKKQSALVQIADHSQAQLVIKHLHGVNLFGQPLQIRMSHHNQVQMPREGKDVEKLTQDYSNSPLHRFKKPGSKNFHNIFAPSTVLHLSNIPHDTDEDTIKDLFNEHGKVVEFKFFSNDKKMALIKLASVDEAVDCLVRLHNYKLAENNHLRVSFSKGHISRLGK